MRAPSEYASYIMEAVDERTSPIKIGGNVLNTGLITNLPQNACVEVPCLVDTQRHQSLLRRAICRSSAPR